MFEKSAEKLGINLTESGSSSDRWETYFALAEFPLDILCITFWGAMSDVFGRKPLMWIPPFFNLYYYIALMAWNFFDLPIEFAFMLGLQRLGGGFGTIRMGCYALVCDVVHPDNVAKRILYLQILYNILNAAVSLASGYIVDELGYITPIFIGVAGNIGIVMYTLFLVPETNIRNTEKKNFKKLFKQVKEGVLLFKSHGNRRKQLQLVCLTLAFFTDYICKTDDILSIVQISWLCWGAIAMSYFESITKVTESMFGLITSRIFKKKISNDTNLILALISGAVEPILIAFTTSAWMLYAAAFLGWWYVYFEPTTRVAFAQAVPPDKIGSIFAVYELLIRISWVINPLVVNTVFSATAESSVRGAAFLMDSAFSFVAVAFALVYVVSKRNEESLSEMKETEAEQKSKGDIEITKF